jgi:hypothetical protein
LEDVRARFNAIQGVRLAVAAGEPGFDLELLRAPEAMKLFKDIFTWFVDRIRSVESAQ